MLPPLVLEAELAGHHRADRGSSAQPQRRGRLGSPSGGHTGLCGVGGAPGRNTSSSAPTVTGHDLDVLRTRGVGEELGEADQRPRISGDATTTLDSQRGVPCSPSCRAAPEPIDVAHRRSVFDRAATGSRPGLPSAQRSLVRRIHRPWGGRRAAWRRRGRARRGTSPRCRWPDRREAPTVGSTLAQVVRWKGPRPARRRRRSRGTSTLRQWRRRSSRRVAHRGLRAGRCPPR